MRGRTWRGREVRDGKRGKCTMDQQGGPGECQVDLIRFSKCQTNKGPHFTCRKRIKWNTCSMSQEFIFFPQLILKTHLPRIWDNRSSQSIKHFLNVQVATVNEVHEKPQQESTSLTSATTYQLSPCKHVLQFCIRKQRVPFLPAFPSSVKYRHCHHVAIESIACWTNPTKPSPA